MTDKATEAHDATPAAEPLALKLTEGLGVAVIVNGAVVAWFAAMDETTEEFCRYMWFGQWLTWRAKKPEVIPLTQEEQAACAAEAKRLFDGVRVE